MEILPKSLVTTKDWGPVLPDYPEIIEMLTRRLATTPFSCRQYYTTAYGKDKGKFGGFWRRRESELGRYVKWGRKRVICLRDGLRFHGGRRSFRCPARSRSPVRLRCLGPLPEVLLELVSWLLPVRSASHWRSSCMEQSPTCWAVMEGSRAWSWRSIWYLLRDAQGLLAAVTCDQCGTGTGAMPGTGLGIFH